MEAVITPSSTNKHFASSNMFAMLYATVVTACLVLSNKIVDIHGLLIAGAVFTFPLLYFFGDIIAEVFGYSLSRRLIWYTLLCGLVFSLLVTIVINLPSPTFQKDPNAFQEVLGSSFKFTVVGVIAMLAGSFSNAYILTKWKILVQGRYFWIRSITSTMVGEFINTILAFPLAFGGKIAWEKLLNIIAVAYGVKMLYAFIAVIPATLIVSYLKKTYGIDVYDYNTDFNPFKLNN